MASMWLTKLKLPLLLILIQATFFALFGFFVDYDSDARPEANVGDNKNTSESTPKAASMLPKFYPMFQDVHVMIFVGFGFLMMFLRRYGFTSMGLNMLLAAITIQWSTLVGGFIHHHGDKFTVSIVSMISADFAAATVLITFGALLGKTSPLQLLVIAMIEVIVYAVNEYIGIVLLQVTDIGGSMFIHAFGAYFGLAVSRVLYSQEVNKSTKEGSVYHSDMFALVGTVFLWIFWPSFNSALAVEDAQHRAVINTYFALAACCVVTFAASSLVNRDGKFDMVHIQNATLAGGVAIGTSADMVILPYGALIVGSLAGLLSVLGYRYVTPFLKSKLKLHDTCGVNNLHGMPALLAGVSGAIAVSMADLQTYGHTLYRQFPAMAPNALSPEWLDLESHVDFKPGQGRSAGMQASYQLIALAVTLAMAAVSGLVVGLIIKCPFLGQPSGDCLFEDNPLWHIPEDTGVGDLTSVIATALSELDRQKSTANKTEESEAPLLGNFCLGDLTLHDQSSGMAKTK